MKKNAISPPQAEAIELQREETRARQKLAAIADIIDTRDACERAKKMKKVSEKERRGGAAAPAVCVATATRREEQDLLVRRCHRRGRDQCDRGETKVAIIARATRVGIATAARTRRLRLARSFARPAQKAATAAF